MSLLLSNWLKNAIYGRYCAIYAVYIMIWLELGARQKTSLPRFSLKNFYSNCKCLRVFLSKRPVYGSTLFLEQNGKIFICFAITPCTLSGQKFGTLWYSMLVGIQEHISLLLLPHGFLKVFKSHWESSRRRKWFISC